MAYQKNYIYELPDFNFGHSGKATMKAEPDKVYISEDDLFVSKIIETGKVVPRNLTLNWVRGSKNLHFYKKNHIVEASYDRIKELKYEDVSLSDLTAIWVYSEETKKYNNQIEYFKILRSEYEKNNGVINQEVAAEENSHSVR